MNAKITLTEEQADELDNASCSGNANEWLNDNLASILTIEPLVITEDVYERFSRIWSNYGLNPALRAFADTHFKLTANQPSDKDQPATFTGQDGKTWTRHDGGKMPCDPDKTVHVFFRIGRESLNGQSLASNWAWGASGGEFDITAWRYADAEPENTQAGKLEEDNLELRSQLEAANQKVRELEAQVGSELARNAKLLEYIQDVEAQLKQAESQAPAQLRPIAERPETVPEGCVRYYFHQYPSGHLSNGVRVPDADSTHAIDILLPAPEDTSRREFEEWAKSEWGDMPEYNSVGWRAWKAARNTKA